MYHIPTLVVGVGIFILYAILYWWYIVSYVNRYEIIIKDDCLLVKSGKLFCKLRLISTVDVVYYERRVGVLSRRFNLCSLRLYHVNRTAFLFGLSSDVVNQIEDKIE